MCAMSKRKLQELCKSYEKPNATLNVGVEKSDSISFSVKYRLSKDEVERFVYNICDYVINADIGTFCLEMKDYYIRVETIKTYTDLDVQDESQWWNIVYGTPIYAMIVGSERRPVIFNGREYDDNLAIDTEQYEEMLDAIKQKIAYYIRRTPGLSV